MLDTESRTKVVRTSLTDPLRIDTGRVPIPGAGKSFTLGITLCPGIKSEGAHDHDWDRDLDLDLAVMRDWGPTHAVHISKYRSDAFDQKMKAALEFGRVFNSQLSHFPTPIDLHEIEEREVLVEKICEDLRYPDVNLLIDGYHGCQECVTFAAQVLIKIGHSLEDSIRMVDEIRPDMFNTVAQTDFLTEYAMREMSHEA